VYARRCAAFHAANSTPYRHENSHNLQIYHGHRCHGAHLRLLLMRYW